MKKCPVCQNTYTDDSLQFCLADGASLTFSKTEQPTEQFSAATNPIRVNIGQDTSPTIISPPQNTPTESAKKSGGGLIIGSLIALLLLVVLGSGAIIGWLLLKDREQGNSNNVVITKQTPNITNSVTQTPTPNETENLKQKIANLEKQVQEQQKKNTTVPTISNPSTNSAPQSNKVTAKVNSPNDGFLALRTEPSAESGDRILQIPHGSAVTILGCLNKEAGKKGRWCRINYDGNVGWSYDGFLIY